MPMSSLFRAAGGQLRGSRIAAFSHLFCMLIGIALRGWRSLVWVPWLLMAAGWFLAAPVIDREEPLESRFHSPQFLAGFIAVISGAGLMMYLVATR